MLCHGNPESGSHCCYVNGARCPNLLEGQQVADMVQFLVTLYGFKGPANTLASRIGDGITYACGVALKAIAESVNATGAIPTRADFESRWVNHLDYQLVGDAWESRGLPRNYCVSYGPNQNQCCFSEDQATNDTRAAGIPVAVRNLRSAIGTV